MGVIATSQARAMFTSMCVDVYQDMLDPTNFLRSFFPSVQEFVRYLSIQVERDLELVAVDVMRGTEGNRNKFSKSTEKVFEPPYYREYTDLTDIDLYDRMFGSVAIDAGIFSQIIAITARRLKMLRNKIERALEIQCSQVLQTGIVTLVNGDSINYLRKSASLVANSGGNTWATITVDPFESLLTGFQFLRTVGKSPDVVFNVICGQQAYHDLINNPFYQKKVTQNLNNNIDSVNPAQRTAAGAAFHGVLSIDSWKANMWTYPQSYDLVSGGTTTPTPYIANGNVVIIPENPRFKMGFAAVPRVLRSGNGSMADTALVSTTDSAQQFLVEDYIDPRLTAHIMDIKSAALAIPTAVDQIYTLTPVAS